MNKPLVSLIVPCYNSQTVIEKCLNNFLKTAYSNFEIIIIDDKSTDETYGLLSKKFAKHKKIRIFKNEQNSGPSYTRNVGIKYSKGKYVGFLETDMEVDPKWLDPLVKALEKSNDLGAVQSKVLDLYKKKYIQAVGLKYDPHTFWVVSLGCGLDGSVITDSEEVGIGAVGCVIRKKVLDRIGGFDEKIVHNLDDIDLGWRIWLTGYKIITIPESITYHWTAKPAKTREKLTPSVASEFYFHKTFRVFLKNYEIINIIRYSPWLFAIYLCRDFINLLKGNTAPLKGNMKSIMWNILNINDTFRERRRIQNLRKNPDSYIFKKIALPGNFFSIYRNQISLTLERIQLRFE